MSSALGAVRRRQRALTRAVVALYGLAWLQAAVVPCAMAHGTAASATHAGHELAAEAPPHARHGGGGPAASADPEATERPCPYCPTAEPGTGSCDDHGGCVYPHEPQVDARGAIALSAVPPASWSLQLSVPRHAAAPAVSELPAAASRVRIFVSYCRLIE